MVLLQQCQWKVSLDVIRIGMYNKNKAAILVKGMQPYLCLLL